jgi:hypothetical protein
MPIPTRSGNAAAKPREDANARSALPVPSGPTQTSRLPISGSRSTTSHARSASSISAKPRVPAGTAAAPNTQAGTRTDLPPSSTRLSHQRTVSALPAQTHNRSQSSSVAEKAVSTASLTSGVKPIRPTGVSRPAFNTFQQHFSPRKQSVSSQGRPSSADAKDVSQHGQPGESPLQDEILQLALVYQHSSETLAQFETSARQKVDVAATKLRKEQEEVTALESRHQQKINATALSKWLLKSETMPVRVKIEDLSFCLNEIANIDQKGQPFDQVMAEFGRWLQIVQSSATPSTWQLESTLGSHKLRTPGETWKDANSACYQRLQTCQALLQAIGDADPQSAIGTVIATNHELVSIMMEKLSTAREIVSKFSNLQQQAMTLVLEEAISSVGVSQNMEGRNGLWRSCETR